MNTTLDKTGSNQSLLNSLACARSYPKPPYMKVLPLFFLVIFVSYGAAAQNDSGTFSKPRIDTAAVLDSMARDLDMLRSLMNEETSYFDINVNIGNQLFSKNNYSLNSQAATANSTGLKPGAGYYHKSGFSLSALAYMNLSASDVGFYQFSFSPAFDKTWEKIVGGISYTHYLTRAKDMVPDFATPYDDEFYAYFNLTKGLIQPGISVGYATGKYTGVYRGKVLGPLGNPVFVIDSQKTRQVDFSVSLFAQHKF